MNPSSMPSRFMLASAATALLAISVAAPAEARPRWGHQRHHDGIDGGDLLLGAILAGGAILLATNIAKNKDRDGRRDNREGDYDRGDRGRAESEAAHLCADAAERQAPRRWSDVRARVDRVEQNGDTTYVRGAVSGLDEYGVDGRERWGDRDRTAQTMFRCAVRFGRIENLSLDDQLALR